MQSWANFADSWTMCEVLLEEIWITRDIWCEESRNECEVHFSVFNDEARSSGSWRYVGIWKPSLNNSTLPSTHYTNGKKNIITCSQDCIKIKWIWPVTFISEWNCWNECIKADATAGHFTSSRTQLTCVGRFIGRCRSLNLKTGLMINDVLIKR
jgi:hypothetical protein